MNTFKVKIASVKSILIIFCCASFYGCNSSSEKSVSSDTISSVSTAVVQADSVISEPEATKPATAVQDEVSPDVAPKEAVKATVRATAVSALNPSEIKKGETLISQSDCLACHKTDETLIGPAYKDVAAKYPKSLTSIKYLSSKIKEGGSGVWGEVPMTPHPTLSDSEAQAMAQYVLSIK